MAEEKVLLYIYDGEYSSQGHVEEFRLNWAMGRGWGWGHAAEMAGLCGNQKLRESDLSSRAGEV